VYIVACEFVFDDNVLFLTDDVCIHFCVNYYNIGYRWYCIVVIDNFIRFFEVVACGRNVVVISVACTNMCSF